MNEPPFRYQRTILIRARPATVFRYFTDSVRFASWWGAGSTIDPRPGGRVHIVYPGGTTAGGEVVAIEADRRIVFTYGYDQKPSDATVLIERGASRVTITLAPHAEGTSLTIVHEVATERMREEHAAGWRFQLSLFANVVAREEHAGLAGRIDTLFAAWSEPDADKRARLLADAATDDVGFRDPYATIAGREDLNDHLAALQKHMPGTRLVREGEPQQCQGVALVRWTAGKASGTNVVRLAPDGRIADVVGFWNS
jgi:uncharacterized protein YndB with AHSA1/START domain